MTDLLPQITSTKMTCSRGNFVPLSSTFGAGRRNWVLSPGIFLGRVFLQFSFNVVSPPIWKEKNPECRQRLVWPKKSRIIEWVIFVFAGAVAGGQRSVTREVEGGSRSLEDCPVLQIYRQTLRDNYRNGIKRLLTLGENFGIEIIEELGETNWIIC